MRQPKGVSLVSPYDPHLQTAKLTSSDYQSMGKMTCWVVLIPELSLVVRHLTACERNRSRMSGSHQGQLPLPLSRTS
jgi:hypothetical protein